MLLGLRDEHVHFPDSVREPFIPRLQSRNYSICAWVGSESLCVLFRGTFH